MLGSWKQKWSGLQQVYLFRGLDLIFIHLGLLLHEEYFDQLFISLGYAQLDATVIGSDAGVTAEMNGGTHMPFEEIGLLRLIPKSIIFEATDDIQFVKS